MEIPQNYEVNPETPRGFSRKAEQVRIELSEVHLNNPSPKRKITETSPEMIDNNNNKRDRTDSDDEIQPLEEVQYLQPMDESEYGTDVDWVAMADEPARDFNSFSSRNQPGPSNFPGEARNLQLSPSPSNDIAFLPASHERGPPTYNEASPQARILPQLAVNTQEISLVVTPIGYPHVIINNTDRNIIAEHINKNIEHRRETGNNDIKIAQDYRSGAMIFRAADEDSCLYVRLAIEDFEAQNHGYNFAFGDLANFPFAVAYTIWTPEVNADFRRLAGRVEDEGIDTSTWRLFKKTNIRSSPYASGTKFSFIADATLRERLNNRGEYKFAYDAYSQRVVIKTAGPAFHNRNRGNKHFVIKLISSLFVL